MLSKIFRTFRTETLILLVALCNKKTPNRFRVLAGLSILYLLFPFDIVPDAIPLLGMCDDLVIVPSILTAVIKFLPDEIRAESAVKAEAVKKNAPWIFLAISLCIAFLVFVLIRGLYS